jgi:hypothetical protein
MKTILTCWHDDKAGLVVPAELVLVATIGALAVVAAVPIASTSETRGLKSCFKSSAVPQLPDGLTIRPTVVEQLPKAPGTSIRSLDFFEADCDETAGGERIVCSHWRSRWKTWPPDVPLPKGASRSRVLYC